MISYRSGHSSANCWSFAWRRFCFDYVQPDQLPAGCCSDSPPSRCDQSPDRSKTHIMIMSDIINNIYNLKHWLMIYPLLGGWLILILSFTLHPNPLASCSSFTLSHSCCDRLKLHHSHWKHTNRKWSEGAGYRVRGSQSKMLRMMMLVLLHNKGHLWHHVTMYQSRACVFEPEGTDYPHEFQDCCSRIDHRWSVR